MNKENKKQNKEMSFEDSVLGRIDSEAIVPEPKMCFMLRNIVFWSLFGVSILVGALAFAGTLFSVFHSGWEYYEITHDSAFVFLVSTLPYVWLVLLIGMVTFGYYNLRKTKRGYKYSLGRILFVAIILSLGGGVTLHAYGVGYVVDTVVGKHAPLHKPALDRVTNLWQDPKKGRLFGTMTENGFKDIDDNYWELDTDFLSDREDILLTSGKQIRIVGKASSTTSIFDVCVVLPGDLRMENVRHEMTERREVFTEERRAIISGERKLSDLRSNRCEGMQTHKKLLR